MKNLIKIAAAEIGVKEFPKDADNPVIVKYAKEAGFKNITDDETPWCSIFINWCCEKAGLQRSHKANARSWLYVGKTVESPFTGDIVVFWRENPNSWKGHVGIFMGYSKSRNEVFVLGGNQRNCVSIQSYDASKVLAFQRLTVINGFEIPKPILKAGSKGEEVEKLQLILNEMGYSCGAVDGIFGNKTTTQLSAFQKQEGIQEANGTYDQKTKTRIESIYQS